MLYKTENKESYDNNLIKHVATKLLESYPDIDESMISFKHKKSDSSKKLKFILSLMANLGNIRLTPHQMTTIKSIISKRMHTFYHTLCKYARKDMFDKLDIQGVYKELGKLVKYEDDGNGPSDKYIKSWTFSYSLDTKDIILSKEETFDKIKEIFTIDDGTSKVDATLTEGGAGAGAATGAGAAGFVEGGDESKENAIVIKYPDMREDKWMTINDVSKMSKFIHGKDLDEIISILEFVFKGTCANVCNVIIDIAGILLDEYKDRAKAYDIILRKYKFE